MGNSYLIKNTREALFKRFNSLSLAELKEYLGNPEGNLKEILSRRRVESVYRLLESQKNIEQRDSLCWFCKHCTNKYRLCSWSKDLTPRSDWEEDDIIRLKNEDGEEGYKVKKCRGFDFEKGSGYGRRIIIHVLTDLFQDEENYITLKYFAKLTDSDLREWVKTYNRICSLVNLEPLNLRQNVVDDEE